MTLGRTLSLFYWRQDSSLGAVHLSRRNREVAAALEVSRVVQAAAQQSSVPVASAEVRARLEARTQAASRALSVLWELVSSKVLAAVGCLSSASDRTRRCTRSTSILEMAAIRRAIARPPLISVWAVGKARFATTVAGRYLRRTLARHRRRASRGPAMPFRTVVAFGSSESPASERSLTSRSRSTSPSHYSLCSYSPTPRCS